MQPGVQIIVQDLPSVIEAGQKLYGDLISFQPHDFFEAQPVASARIYYLRYIAHDWPDEICRSILRHLVTAMDPQSKLLIFDMIWKEDSYWARGKDDQDLIDGCEFDWKHSNGTRNMHMMNLMGKSHKTTLILL